mgnify:CR=1 FL=1
MPDVITIPEQTIPIGSYAHEIDAPARRTAARITLTRPGAGWPIGAVLTYRIFERERGGNLLLLTGTTEMGGPIIGKGGVVNPPLVIGLSWPDDRDKDVIRFEVEVLQAITTAITVEFL